MWLSHSILKPADRGKERVTKRETWRRHEQGEIASLNRKKDKEGVWMKDEEWEREAKGDGAVKKASRAEQRAFNLF